MRFLDGLTSAGDGLASGSRIGRAIGVAAAAVLVAVTCSTPAAAQPVEYWGNFGGGTPWLSQTPLSLEGATAVEASNSSSYALVNGSVYAWGRNDHGQLGDGLVAREREVQSSPVRVTLPVRAVALGEAEGSGAAIDAQGHGWVWGLNPEGAMCVSGSVISTPVETPVENAVMVQGGESHTLWLLANGTVVACGTNKNGELGNDSHTNSSTPVQVLGLGKVVEVSAGEFSSCARTASGEVWDWGGNGNGQLGDGTETNSYVPVRVSLPGPASQVSCGGNLANNGHSLALVGGELYGWGADQDGQIGDGGGKNRLLPVRTGLKFTAVVASGSSSLGLDSEGNVWAWGQGAAGEGAGQNALVPVLMRSGATAISGTARDEESLGTGG
jgi:alpha-tubulin suppressor-like RCC1 family protein